MQGQCCGENGGGVVLTQLREEVREAPGRGSRSGIREDEGLSRQGNRSKAPEVQKLCAQGHGDA